MTLRTDVFDPLFGWGPKRYSEEPLVFLDENPCDQEVLDALESIGRLREEMFESMIIPVALLKHPPERRTSTEIQNYR